MNGTAQAFSHFLNQFYGIETENKGKNLKRNSFFFLCNA